MDKDYLLELMLANLEHARHVENERLTFNSIYIAVVAGFFALAFDLTNPILTIFFIGILLVISIIGFLFTKRWSDVFEGHMGKAQELAIKLYGFEHPNAGEPIANKYYYFSHDYKKHSIMLHQKRAETKGRYLSFEEAAAEVNFNDLPHKLGSIRTKMLFYLFYGVVILVLTIFFFYSIIRLILG